MRAKRPILLYCADPELLSATAFALRLHNYDVAAVREIQDAMALARSQNATLACCVLMHAQQADPAGRLIHLLLESDVHHLPLLLVDRAGDLAQCAMSIWCSMAATPRWRTSSPPCGSSAERSADRRYGARHEISLRLLRHRSGFGCVAAAGLAARNVCRDRSLLLLVAALAL